MKLKLDYLYLHSNMVLLKSHFIFIFITIYFYLHSNMVLLKLKEEIKKSAAALFTFQYGTT